jgi:hypothetical protein
VGDSGLIQDSFFVYQGVGRTAEGFSGADAIVAHKGAPGQPGRLLTEIQF